MCISPYGPHTIYPIYATFKVFSPHTGRVRASLGCMQWEIEVSDAVRIHVANKVHKGRVSYRPVGSSRGVERPSGVMSEAAQRPKVARET